MTTQVDTDALFQPVRICKTGQEGVVTKAVPFLEETYIEVQLEDGRTVWPLHTHDVEVRHGAR